MLTAAIRWGLLGLWLLAATATARPRPASAPVPLSSLEFITNGGQWPAAVRYAAPLAHGRLFLEARGWTYALAEAADLHAAASPSHREALRAHAVRMEFVGAQPDARLQPSRPTGEVRNYFTGNDPKSWAQGVAGYRELRYQQLWPGIDVRLYENLQQQLEYDFELAAGATPARIRQRYTGAEHLQVGEGGRLLIKTSVGTITELAPRAYQLDDQGQQQVVSCRYMVSGQEVSFALGRYDAKRPLVIDPTVVFSSFTGSTADNWGFTATYDQQGNMYSGGIVFGLGYPASPGAYSTSFSGNLDMAIIKYNTAATGPAARVWATYLGGSSGEYPQSMVVNSRNELIILGTTGSSNYPTTAMAYDRSFNGGISINPYGSIPDPVYSLPQGTDLVITRLNAAGSALLGSTFLGGSANEGLIPQSGSTFDNLQRNYGDQFRGDVLVDASDNIYIASNTASPNFPVRNNFQGARGGGLDAVVSKLAPDLSNITWSSYLGGGNPDAAYSLQLDGAGRLYVCGGTSSFNFPSTSGALQTSYQGNVDGFAVRISASGTQLERSTFIGTSQYDQTYFVQLDGSGAVYLLGQSLGQYPVSSGRYVNPNSRQFIHKLNADLTTTDFSTVFGSGRSTIDISPTAFLVDQCNRIYVSGWGGGNNAAYGNGQLFGMPTTAAAVQRITDGNDFYLMQLSAGATQLEYATFFGGSGQDHVDGGTSRFDRRGLVYQAVCGGCGGLSNFPIPPGAGSYSTVNNSDNCNNAAFKFDFEPERATVGPARTVCSTAAPVALSGTPAGGIWSGPGVSGSAAAGYVFNAGAVPLGTVALIYTVTNNLCVSQTTLQVTVVPPPTISFTPLAQTVYCTGSAPVALTASPASGTFSGPGVQGSTFSPALAGPGTHTLTYSFTSGGCTASATQQVTVTGASAGPGIQVCAPSAPVALTTGSPAGGVWTGQYVTGSAASGYFFAPPAGASPGPVQLTYTVTAVSGCTSSSNLTATIRQTPVVAAPSQTQFCSNSSQVVALPTGAVWTGRGVQGFATTGFSFSPALAGAGQHVLSYVASNAGCESRGTVTMSVGAPASISLPADTLLCPGSTQAFVLRATPAGGTWSGPYLSPAGTFTPPPSFAGPVTLTYTVQSNGCTSTATRRVGVATIPPSSPRWAPLTCAEDREAPLRVRFTGADGIGNAQWDLGDGSTYTGPTAEHVYGQPGRYQPRVVIRYNNGRCVQETQLPAVEVKAAKPVPNIITPNGDDQNEVFEAAHSCPPQLQVFSRWGQKVYESAAYQNDWNGGTQPAGTYYYLMRFPDGRRVKGWLEIVR